MASSRSGNGDSNYGVSVSSTFTEWLRDTAGEAWKDAISHRFTQDVANDRLSVRVFRRYLVQEYAFVDTSAKVLGYAIAKAPSIPERAHLSKALEGLVTDQEEFFRTAFKKLDVAEEEHEFCSLANEVECFNDFVLRIAATGTYDEILANMLAAEWMYLTWCGRAAGNPSSHPLIREWVALHAQEPFREGVAWLRAELDAVGPQLDSEHQLRLARLFVRTLELEIAFHSVPFQES